ncbi:DUF6302 family protein [Streptomyces sp. NPDC058947]|uniref:DUF6302 family protein n=1 Tax=Streptomyces sp. NPDC058947 TaxID=3346675 RepID=UPI0036A7C4A6
MLTAPARTAPLTITAVPPAQAYDYGYFLKRLAAPGILEGAVALRGFRALLLAVPVGGPRHGGYMSFDLCTVAQAAKAVLDGRPGFPELRVRWSPYRDTCHVVEWGGHPPDGDAERGHFYGYSDEAIAKYLTLHTPLTPSSAPADL